MYDQYNVIILTKIGLQNIFYALIPTYYLEQTVCEYRWFEGEL